MRVREGFAAGGLQYGSGPGRVSEAWPVRHMPWQRQLGPQFLQDSGLVSPGNLDAHSVGAAIITNIVILWSHIPSEAIVWPILNIAQDDIGNYCCLFVTPRRRFSMHQHSLIRPGSKFFPSGSN